MRSNRRVVYQGESYTAAQVARMLNIKPRPLHRKLSEGLSLEEALAELIP